MTAIVIDGCASAGYFGIRSFFILTVKIGARAVFSEQVNYAQTLELIISDLGVSISISKEEVYLFRIYKRKNPMVLILSPSASETFIQIWQAACQWNQLLFVPSGFLNCQLII